MSSVYAFKIALEVFQIIGDFVRAETHVDAVSQVCGRDELCIVLIHQSVQIRIDGFGFAEEVVALVDQRIQIVLL